MAKNEIVTAEIAKSRDFRSATQTAKTFIYDLASISEPERDVCISILHYLDEQQERRKKSF